MLLTAAFKEEAAFFIKQLNLQKKFEIIDGLFTNNNNFLLITGKGIINAKQKFEHFINLNKKFSGPVYNFGICGKLKDKILLNHIYEINRVIVLNNKDNINSIKLADQNIKDDVNCISVTSPVQNKQVANRLKNYADVVDMELWAYAEVCKRKNFNLVAFKYVSDDANEETSLKSILKNITAISEKLFNYYLENYSKHDLV